MDIYSAYRSQYAGITSKGYWDLKFSKELIANNAYKACNKTSLVRGMPYKATINLSKDAYDYRVYAKIIL